jgi:fluoroquinolone transport system permease protein
MFVLPLLFGFLFRWAAQLVSPWLAEGFGIDLAAYNVLIGSALVLITPMMFGVVIGFLLLDQKDDGTLTALRVTPLTARGYLAYRITVPVALSILMTPVVLITSGFSQLTIGEQLVAGMAAAPLAPAFALFLAAFARNKVQGFALMKAAGVINWPPIMAWFVNSNWQLAFGLCPTYWPAKVYWELEAGHGSAWIYLLASFAVFALVIALFQRRFERAMT